MTWLRLDDHYGDDPRLVAAGPLAVALDTAARVYAARHETDGRIPARVVPRLVDWSADGLTVDNADLARRLVASGAWVVSDDGTTYEIVGFLDTNPSRAEQERRRAERSAAGQAGAARRWGQKAEPMAPAIAPAIAPDMAVAMSRGHAPSRPVPSRPDPVPTTTTAQAPEPARTPAPKAKPPDRPPDRPGRPPAADPVVAALLASAELVAEGVDPARVAAKLRADALAMGCPDDRLVAAVTAAVDQLATARLDPQAPRHGAAGFVVGLARSLGKPGALEAHRAKWAPRVPAGGTNGAARGGSGGGRAGPEVTPEEHERRETERAEAIRLVGGSWLDAWGSPTLANARRVLALAEANRRGVQDGPRKPTLAVVRAPPAPDAAAVGDTPRRGAP